MASRLLVEKLLSEKPLTIHYLTLPEELWLRSHWLNQFEVHDIFAVPAAPPASGEMCPIEFTVTIVVQLETFHFTGLKSIPAGPGTASLRGTRESSRSNTFSRTKLPRLRRGPVPITV